jgi:uncharacterized protein (DUF2235 family)
MKEITMQLKKIALFALIILISACASRSSEKKSESLMEIPTSSTHPLNGDPSIHKSIFVFLDGTANNRTSSTNVWRLYEMITKINDPQMTGFYIEGVGSAEDPLDTGHLGQVQEILELGLGKNMQDRILKGYEFIARNYNPGDDVYIFGFSRGAHQARSLAGLIAYSGVPKLSDEDRKQLAIDKDYLKKIGNDILELTKKKIDEDYLDEWKSWNSSQAPLLAEEIKNKKINGKKGREMLSAEVAFLGVWDTVPGSSLKSYEICKEHKGFIKRLFNWVPGVDRGERYKTDSYPPIRRIAHAVSLDEKRSKFSPILVCKAIDNPNPTNLNEQWFPGAHADVGGGYDDSDELPSITLNWMIKLLEEKYQYNTSITPVAENAIGRAHWSIDDYPANKFSDCVDRKPPEGAQINS